MTPRREPHDSFANVEDMCLFLLMHPDGREQNLPQHNAVDRSRNSGIIVAFGRLDARVLPPLNL